MSFGYQILGFGAGDSGLTYMDATGGTVTEDGDYKVHTFTSPGTFTVVAVGEDAVPATYKDQISYMVVAAGGGSGSRCSGGGGAGGWRANNNDAGGDFSPESPLAAPVSSFTVSASPGSYPVTVGSGSAPGSLGYYNGSQGGTSSAFSITSAGGGGGGYNNGPSGTSGSTGGSGGGGGAATAAGGSGPGNNPPTSPPQGNPGGAGVPGGGGAGSGGGAAGAGGGYNVPGPGTPHSISGADVTYSNGGNPVQPACEMGNGQGPATPSGSRAGNNGGVIIRYRVAGKP